MVGSFPLVCTLLASACVATRAGVSMSAPPGRRTEEGAHSAQSAAAAGDRDAIVKRVAELETGIDFHDHSRSSTKSFHKYDHHRDAKHWDTKHHGYHHQPVVSWNHEDCHGRHEKCDNMHGDDGLNRKG
mmetsp:Transcript_46440/g.104678  ORF Transcript_46440/g.104678 Transcript_46440/m.104678 type:complete len:129 (-) Transcript_46440:1097-1483(-)